MEPKRQTVFSEKMGATSPATHLSRLSKQDTCLIIQVNDPLLLSQWGPGGSLLEVQVRHQHKCLQKMLSCTIRLRVSCGLCPFLPLHLHMAARKNQRQTLSFIALSRGLLFPRDRLCWGVSELSPTDPENIANERARFSGRKKKTSFQAQ